MNTCECLEQVIHERAENIPLSILEDVADMIYDMMVRTDERAQTKKAA